MRILIRTVRDRKAVEEGITTYSGALAFVYGWNHTNPDNPVEALDDALLGFDAFDGSQVESSKTQTEGR